MKFIVCITFRDDKTEEFECWDTPYVSDWITLYLNDERHTRKMFPKEAIASMYYYLSL